jgi:asparagine synthase (glutamine-hydrolysing)
MCGISGFIGFYNLNNPEKIINQMGNSLTHRGPDNGNVWIDYDNQIALYHNRLSIIDIDKRSNQPMKSKSGRHIILYNGEVYNFKELRREIDDYYKNKNTKFIWQTSSDTEVLLEGIEIWGLKHFICKVEGMFSIAIWDKKKKSLFLCRDRFGEKPLYYGINDDLFFFCSELKALAFHPNIKRSINKESVLSFIKNSQIAAPNTIYENIFKLLPGTILEYSLSTKKKNIDIYWSAKDIVEKGDKIDNDETTHNKIVDEFDHLIYKTIKKTIISDRPVAFFLSGGIDSSLITSVANSFTDQKINTFTAGFEGQNSLLDEKNYAKKISKYLETDHEEYLINESDLFNNIDEMSKIFCEPFGDSSQIPTYLISKKMNKNFTVAISGDGGDEIFGGYYRNFRGYNSWNKIKNLSKTQKKILSFILNFIKTNLPLENVEIFLKKNRLNFLPIDLKLKISKLINLINQKNLKEYYSTLVSSDFNKKEFDNGVILDNLLNEIDNCNISDYDKIMLMDINFYLPNDILTKVDRASMAASLETRAPFLNHLIYEKCVSIPKELKFKNNTPKFILKNILSRYIPLNLFNRPKQGFEIPINNWLLGKKKGYYKSLIFDKSTNLYEVLSYGDIVENWKRFEKKDFDFSKLFWNILMYQMWFKKNF